MALRPRLSRPTPRLAFYPSPCVRTRALPGGAVALLLPAASCGVAGLMSPEDGFESISEARRPPAEPHSGVQRL